MSDGLFDMHPGVRSLRPATSKWLSLTARRDRDLPSTPHPG